MKNFHNCESCVDADFPGRESEINLNKSSYVNVEEIKRKVLSVFDGQPFDITEKTSRNFLEGIIKDRLGDSSPLSFVKIKPRGKNGWVVFLSEDEGLPGYSIDIT